MKFKDTLTEAVRDMVNHGYDDQRRVDEWMGRLRQAAEADMLPPREVEKRLKAAMDMFYRRALSKSSLKKRHPDVSYFTIKQIEPDLRPELTKRILASADLIKLNRDKAVEQTLQRFSGWATSIPQGGSRVVDKTEVKANIAKSMQQLKYEERRVQIDQGHKLMSNIDQVIAQQTNAIAGTWYDRGSTDKSYNARHDHLARSGKTYAVRGNWAMEKGLMNKGAGYLDEMTAPGEEVFCSCSVTYHHALRDLPSDMLTQKGKKLLEETRIA